MEGLLEKSFNGHFSTFGLPFGVIQFFSGAISPFQVKHLHIFTHIYLPLLPMFLKLHHTFRPIDHNLSELKLQASAFTKKREATMRASSTVGNLQFPTGHVGVDPIFI